MLRGSAVVTAYRGYRYPVEAIGHAVWLYHRFALSLRDVEELMLARGVVVSHETIRSWCAKFGPDYASQRFLFSFSHIREHFRPRRHLMSAPQ
jgi:transposase-like protein